MEIYMRDYLLDIIKNTHNLGRVPLVKITGNQDETRLSAIADERLFVVDAKFHNPLPDFVGCFGMPNLGRLSVILNTDEYKEDASITVTKHNNEPIGIHFKNKAGDFKNDYRLMNSTVANQLLPDVTFHGAKWNVELVPTVQSIQRMKFQSTINSDENLFYVKTDENNNLVFRFGDPATLNGEFVFEQNIKGSLKSERAYPVQAILSILNLNGDKIMKFSPDGVVMITVDSGLALYNYILLALQK